jgi:hypothetical protein
MRRKSRCPRKPQDPFGRVALFHPLEPAFYGPPRHKKQGPRFPPEPWIQTWPKTVTATLKPHRFQCLKGGSRVRAVSHKRQGPRLPPARPMKPELQGLLRANRRGGYMPEAGTPGGPTVNRWGGYCARLRASEQRWAGSVARTGSLCPASPQNARGGERTRI